MTPRSIRRAAERKAKKLERKVAEQQSAPQHEDASVGRDLVLQRSPRPPAEPVSPAQLEANRLNAQLSTGPTSYEGKSKSCLNAVKTGLTGQTVLLPSDDAAAYQEHIRAYAEEFKPVGQRECDLVQSIADIWWRLRRIPSLESAIFALGLVEFARKFDDHAPSERPSLIEVHTFFTYEKQLRNLQIQECRLNRQRQKAAVELRELQQERKQKEAEALGEVAKRYEAARKHNQPVDQSSNGFEFSIAQIEAHIERSRRSQTPRTLANAA